MTTIRPTLSLGGLLNFVPTVALLAGLLGAPIFALAQLDRHDAAVIEAPATSKKGVGFVLLVSLQRA